MSTNELTSRIERTHHMDNMNAYLISREDLTGTERIPLCGCASMAQAENIALLLARTLWQGTRVYITVAGQDTPTTSYLR